MFVSSTLPGMPWAIRPISFLKDFPHTSLYRGLLRRWRYSIISLVSPSKTAPAISHNNFIGNFRDANCLGVAGVLVGSMHESMTSWVSVLHLDLVFFAGVLPSSFVILFGFGEHGCCYRSTVLCGSIIGNGGDVTTISFSSNGSRSNGSE